MCKQHLGALQFFKKVCKQHLGTGALAPENLGEVVSVSVLESVLKHLHLLHQHQVVVVGRHLGNNNENIELITICINLQSMTIA